MEGVEHIGSELRIYAQTQSKSKDFQFRLAVQPKVAVQIDGLPTDDRVAFYPGFDSDAQRAEFPVLSVAHPGSHRQLMAAEHEVGVGLKDLNKLGADALLAWVFDTDVEMPSARIA